ncbi:WD40-repeat-containing domain protein [Limtongia smithiae]|uniref:WD40-repeat-containing domain protein n=1 Tax=Limtongia smithiae TaxID=1125753 RepID=UPI0034CF96A6
MADYSLSRSLTGHTGDVRGVVFPSPSLLASVSRDCTLRVWKPLPGSEDSSYGIEWTESVNYQSPRYLNSVAYLDDVGLIASAGLDTQITVSSPHAAGAPAKYTLKGHEGNVCSLHYADGVLISGSWDTTARVWVDGNCKSVLRGHSAAVWAVLVLSPGTYLTGSADKTICLWNNSTCVATFRGHTDVVRALCLISPTSFASASNDGSVRIWNLSTHICVSELYGHSSFVYSLAYVPLTGEIVSTSEDRSIRVWKEGQCMQAIACPCTSVWTVAVCAATGDIAAGGSDGVVRLFTRDKARTATEDEILKFHEQVASYAISTTDTGSVNKEKLPGEEALDIPGTKNGQVMMVKSPVGAVVAYQWSDGKWNKIGEVVSAVGQTQKQLYDGREYDYVFEVDIKDGVPPLKLPYNATENPYDAARRFLEKNELPLSYLDETAKFIEQNTAGVQIGTQAPASDPYGSRYVPPPEAPAASSSRPSASAGPPPKSTLFPQKTYIYVKKANVPMLMKKTTELNAAKTGSAALTPDELATTATLLKTADTNGLTSDAAVTLAMIGLKIAENWTAAEKLSGLDILRVAVGSVDDAAVMSRLANAIVADRDDGIFSVPNNGMMATRVFANMFESTAGRILVCSDMALREAILDRVRDVATKPATKLTAIALSTLLLNFCVVAAQGDGADAGAGSGVAFSVIGIMTEYLSLVQESESAYRLLVGLGTLLAGLQGAQESGFVKEAALSLDGPNIVSTSKLRFGSEARLQTAADDVLAWLR